MAASVCPPTNSFPFRQVFLLLPSSRIANLPLDFLKGEIFMRYTVTTFKVRLEASEVGDRSGESDYVGAYKMKAA